MIQPKRRGHQHHRSLQPSVRIVSALCALVLATGAPLPASAQIVLGGQPAAVPGAAATPVTMNFPVDPDLPDYKPVSIAAPDFTAATEVDATFATQVAEVVRADLASSGLFAAPDPASIAAFPADMSALPVWTDWTGAGVAALLLGKASVGEDGRLTLQFRLYDVAAAKQILGKQYVIPASDKWRRAAHKVSDDVLVALAGGVSGFDSRITFVSEGSGETKLGIVDPDGGSLEFPLARVNGLSAPQFSPQTQTIIYSADAPVPGKPTQAQRTTIMYDMVAGSRAPVSTKQPQPNADARYSPNGRSLIYSRKVGANTDIYLLDVATGREIRLTDDKAADTAPSLSPDGKRFVFASDREGPSRLYVAAVDGAPVPCASGESKVCRVTQDRGADTTPAWSPRGDWIAFSRRIGESAGISLVKPDGSGERALTSPANNSLDLTPSFSPEGRRVVYAHVVSDSSALYVANIAGGEPRLVPTTDSAFEPSWGPQLP